MGAHPRAQINPYSCWPENKRGQSNPCLLRSLRALTSMMLGQLQATFPKQAEKEMKLKNML